MKYRKVAALISIVLVSLSCISLGIKQLNWGLDLPVARWLRLHIPALLCLKKFVKPSMRKVGMATSSNSLALIGIYWFECPPRKIDLSERTHVWAMHFR